MRLSYLVVSVPLLLHGATPAFASSTAAEEAVRLLASAEAADRKCDYLSSQERQELSRYTARAEVAAASQASSKAARTAATEGAAEGRASSCSAALEADIRETLIAAREAVAAANAAAKPATDQASSKSKTKTTAALNATRQSGLQKGDGSLGLYTRVVRAYYLERECLSLSRSQGQRFWKGVAELHREVLARNGRKAVARAMADAERRAAGSSCGSNVRAQIERGYQEISSR